MIDSKDLRIGNIVLGENNELIEVETVYYDGINYVDGHVYGTVFENLKPIKLTSEIFEQIEVSEKTSRNYFRILTDGYFSGYEFKIANDRVLIYDDNGHEVTSIKCLHELQNLYYALTNKELPININTLKV